MNLLFRIVYAAHANGTHHKLALDALRHVDVPDCERWQRLFLEHVELYLDGAKAPDNQFKDFKNHVLHVRDGYWGGAVDKVESWYDQLVVALTKQRWNEAVYAAGILSHYVTDPIHPFHTAQSEAENNIHRAAEWSISKSYDELRKIGEAGPPALELTIGEGPTWLRDLVCRSAEISNANYERLIAHYDIHRGVVDPPSGLDSIARGLVADLLVYAARVHAAILQRAFMQSGVAPPDVNLSADTVVAALKIPVKWLTKKLADSADRRLVEAMYDELKATGRVEENLPADDRTVRELHRTEVLGRQGTALEEQRALVVSRGSHAGAASSVAAKAPPVRAGARPGPQPTLTAQLQKVAPPTSAPPTTLPAPVTARENPTLPLSTRPATAPATLVGPAAPSAASAAPNVRPGPALASTTPAPATNVYLVATDDLERAPSIGPKTAERFATLGIKTVADFLRADPAALAAKVGARHITDIVLLDWQDQARLVMGVPGLRGTHAQLLVGAGFRTVAAVAAADPDKLCAAILGYATAPDGQRILRDGNPPDIARIKGWCDSARQALAA